MIKVYGIEQAEQWDAVVRSFPTYDAYWLSGYVMRTAAPGASTWS